VKPWLSWPPLTNMEPPCVEKRIREQLERSERLRHNCVFKINSVGLKLPAADCQERVEKLVQEVADGIVEITMTTLRRGESSTN